MHTLKACDRFTSQVVTVFKINLLECLQADVYFVYVCDMYIYIKITETSRRDSYLTTY